MSPSKPRRCPAIDSEEHGAPRVNYGGSVGTREDFALPAERPGVGIEGKHRVAIAANGDETPTVTPSAWQAMSRRINAVRISEVGCTATT